MADFLNESIERVSASEEGQRPLFASRHEIFGTIQSGFETHYDTTTTALTSFRSIGATSRERRSGCTDCESELRTISIFSARVQVANAPP